MEEPRPKHCKPVQEILCGHCPLRDEQLVKIFERIADSVGMALDDEWSPTAKWGDPVIWRSRDQNTVADFLANYSMDLG
eukprot:420284-Karenia_brevis.AAC.1